MFANQSKIHIVDAYVAESEFASTELKLILLYKGRIANIIPHSSEYIIWKQVEDDAQHALYADYNEDNWTTFKTQNFNDYQNLLQDFEDPKCITVSF